MSRSILYIGQLIDPSKVTDYSGSSSAGALFEWNLVNSFSEANNIINVVSIPPVATWPHDKKIIYKNEKIKELSSFDGVFAGFINSPIIKQFSQVINTYYQGKRIIHKCKPDVIFSYNTYPQVGIPAYILTKKYNIRHVCILADLPFDDRAERNWIRKMVWSVFGGIAWNLIKHVKEFVILNRNASDFLPTGSKYCVMEGAINPDDFIYSRETKTDINGNRIIVYSGALTMYSGVFQLIESMEALEDIDVVLHIYGDGDQKENVLQKISQHKNVKYMGKVSVKEIRKIQANSWLLVNPRCVDDQISKVTFPSKILEYMASGTPVLSTRINGLEREYLDKIIICNDNTPKEISKSIRNASENKNLDLLGINARKFVFSKKKLENSNI